VQRRSNRATCHEWRLSRYWCGAARHSGKQLKPRRAGPRPYGLAPWVNSLPPQVMRLEAKLASPNRENSRPSRSGNQIQLAAQNLISNAPTLRRHTPWSYAAANSRGK